MEKVAEANLINQLLEQSQSILNQASERTQEQLKPFVNRQAEKDEIFACFELFYISTDNLGYNKFFIKETDDGHKKLDTDWQPASGSYDDAFLPELTGYLDDQFSKVELSVSGGPEFTEKLESIIFKWFTNCWFAVGGAEAVVPTFFCFEKEYKVSDMKTGEIMEESEAAKKLGYSVE